MKNSILFTKKGETANKSLGLFLFLFTLLLSVNVVVGQVPCSLVAEDHILASVDENCEATITVDAVLDGTLTSCPGGVFTVYIYDGLTEVASGNPAVVPAGYVGQTLHAVVTEAGGNSSNPCQLDIFDNLAPSIACYEKASDVAEDISAGDPTYLRTSSNGPSTVGNCVAGATTVNYDVFEFKIDQADDFTFSLDGSAAAGAQFFVALYEGSFDPVNPCENFLYDDFAPALAGNVEIPITLSDAAASYILVTTTVANGQAGAYTWTFTSLGGAEVLAKKADCNYELYSYQDIDEEVIIFGEDNCDAPNIVLLNETVLENNCALMLPDELIRQIDRVYAAEDLATPTNQSPLLNVHINVSKLPDALYYGSIFGPDDFKLALGNAISCDDDFESTTNGCCEPTGFPVPADVGGPGSPGVPYIDILGDITSLLTPDLTNNLSAVYIDMELTGPDATCLKKVMRMWTVTEWACVERAPRVFFQEIEVADFTAPVLTCPANEVYTTDASGTFPNTTFGTVYCGADFTFPAPQATDNCQTDLIWDINVINDNGIAIAFYGDVSWSLPLSMDLPLGLNTINYTVSDECGNTSDCSFTVLVEDKTPPIAICQQFTTVALTYDGEADVPAQSFDSGSFDDCQFDRVEVRRMDEPGDTFYPFVTFSCNDIGDDVMVIMRAFDIFNNWSECMVSVQVQDKLDPIIECPDNMINLDCDYFYELTDLDTYFGTATAYDNCDVEIAQDYELNVDQCGVGTLIRFFVATDPDGRTDDCIQMITFTNAHNFACGPNNIYDPNNTYGDIEWPADNMDLQGCLDPYSYGVNSILHPNQSGWPVLHEDACDLVGPTYHDEVFAMNDNDQDADGACFKIIRTWTVKDWCNRLTSGVFASWSYDQTLMVNNYDVPEFSRIIADTTVCTYDVTCTDGYIGLTMTSSDECTDDEDLRWQYLIDYDNDNGVNNFDYNSPIYSGNSLDASGDYPIGTHRILWKIWDQCGNSAFQEHTFTIMNCKKPTPICLVGLSTDVAEMNGVSSVTIYAEFYNDNSYHTCGYPLAISYSSDPNDNERVYNCDDLGFHDIEMWVTAFLPDGSITQDFCITEVEIQNNMDACDDPTPIVQVAGTISTENNDPVTGMQVELDGSEFADVLSDENGHFAFPEMIGGGDYVLRPENNEDHDNGVSTLDLIHVQKHLLGLKAISSPYKMIAADVNNDQKVSASDLLNARQLILGVNDKFDNNTSWRFIQANYKFENEANPLTEAIPETDVIDNITQDLTSDFIAIKVGDITNDASLNGDAVIDSRNAKTLVFDVDAVDLSSGNLEIPVYANEFNQINGFQYTLNYNDTALEFEGLESGALNMTSTNYNQISKSQVTMSWSKAMAVDVVDGTKLFTLKFKVSQKANLHNNLEITSDLTKAEAYDGDLNSMDVKLNYRNLETGDYALYQNKPNPFSENTTISFNMKEGGDASLTIYDINGKVLRTIQANFNRGLNAITVNKKDLPVNGMLYYQLNTDEFTATKKMILVK